MAVKLLNEKIPKDLARAYQLARHNQVGGGPYNYANARQKGFDTDFEHAHYEEISPADAIAIRKNGDITKLRLIVKGHLVDFYNDGTQRNHYVSDWRESYVNKNGNKVTSTKRIPFKDLVKIADKIYLTDEDEVTIPDDKLARRDADDRYYNLRLGAIRPESDLDIKYGRIDMDRSAEVIRTYKAELKKLEIDWEAGNVSPNEYAERKARLEKHIANATTSFYRGKHRSREPFTKARNYVANQAASANVRRYKELKSELHYAQRDYERSQEKLTDIQSQGANAEQYAYAQKRIQQLKAEIEAAKRQIEYYEKQLSTDSVNADTQKAMNAVEADLQKIRNLQNEFDRIMRRTNNESFDVKGYGKLTIKEG